MQARTTKLVPIVAVVGIVFVGWVLYKSLFNNANDKSVSAAPAMKSLPALPASPKEADADTAIETLNTVVAGNRSLEAKINQVLDENKALRLERESRQAAAPAIAPFNPNLAPGAAPVVPPPAAPVVTPPATAQAPVGDVLGESLNKAVDGGKALLNVFTPKTQAVGDATPPNGIPIGLGFEGGAEYHAKGGDPSGLVGGQRQEPNRLTYKTVFPMGYEDPKDAGAGGTRSARNAIGNTNELPDGRVGRTDKTGKDLTGKDADIPYYTIPENGTMSGAVAMTAIVGRIPIDGKVTDPMQFKAIIGRENLAANGWEMPGDLEGIVVSGVAVGDMTLSCSEGKIKSLTFVFRDGTIRTVSQRKGGGAGTDLGYISDQYGNPCIPGKFITNAPTYLTQIVGIKAFSAAAEAYAKAQTTTTLGGITSGGASSTTVTGDTDKYVLGKAASDGASEITQWLLSRMKNSFDAIVTPAGGSVVIHIDQQIAIDKETRGRKIVHQYQTPTANAGSNHGLD